MRSSLFDVDKFKFPREEDFIQVVYKAIAAGLAPWSPGKVTAYRTDDVAIWKTEYFFVTELLPDYKFKSQVDIELDPAATIGKMANEAYRFFLFRPALPVDDHIVLGEE